ncbi:hypothetical protein [Priestia megaterium]|uniref:hypothetical protein n=1 Tax=Priestia megaterium TaxID=1404 RepID=UPI003EEF52AC
MMILDKETHQYIQGYIAGHTLRFPGEAIMDIYKKYRTEKKKEWSLDYIMKTVSENLYDVLNSKLKKIRLGTNSADENTQILIAYMNGLFAHHKFQGLLTTEYKEMDSTRIAREVVEGRILNQREKRLVK